MTVGGAPGREWAETWQRSWDRLQESYAPKRELLIGVLFDLVEAIVPTGPTVLDLACGTGTITRRLLTRFPRARSIALDVDPVMLTIASATFADDERVRIVEADLRDSGWVNAMPEPQVDAVLTATALHWIPEHAVRHLYQDLARLVRPGGLLAHAERMPLNGLTRLGEGLAQVERQRHRLKHANDRADWDRWWEGVASDPALATPSVQRRNVFPSNYPAEEFSPPADWHIEALSKAGFDEVGVVWRSGNSAVVAAVR